MRTYTEEQLKELGIPFYEDFAKKLKDFVESSKYFNIDPSTLDEWELQETEYQEYWQYSWYYGSIKDLTGPMDLGDIVAYVHFPY